MPYEMWWVLAVVILAAVLLTFRVVQLHVRESHRARVRELLHKERMLALERGVPLPEIPMELAEPPPHNPGALLRIGIIFMALGGGLAPALYFSKEDNLQEVWTLGFIPFALGAGCLISAWAHARR